MTTSEETNLYQLVLMTKEDKKEILDKIEKTILDLNGKVTFQESWGKKALAYRIKGEDSAYYFLWKIALSKKNTQEVRKKLNFNEKIIRYLLLKVQ